MNMANKKNAVILSLLALTFLFAISMALVSGAVVSPASSSTVSGTIVLNATNASLPQMLNCTFSAGSTLTANTSVTLGTFTNATANPLNINGTFNTATLEDANNYIFTAVCTNSTNSQTTSTSTAVVIDNTVPQTPTLSPASNPTSPQTSATTQTFTATVTGANTTACTYSIARGGASSGSDYITGTATHSGNTCTFTKAFTTTLDNGVWKWSVTASDGTNSSASTQNDYVAQLTASNGGLPVDDSNDLNGNPAQGSNTFWWILGIVLILIIVAVVLWQKM